MRAIKLTSAICSFVFIFSCHVLPASADARDGLVPVKPVGPIEHTVNKQLTKRHLKNDDWPAANRSVAPAQYNTVSTPTNYSVNQPSSTAGSTQNAFESTQSGLQPTGQGTNELRGTADTSTGSNLNQPSSVLTNPQQPRYNYSTQPQSSPPQSNPFANPQPAGTSPAMGTATVTNGQYQNSTNGSNGPGNIGTASGQPAWNSQNSSWSGTSTNPAANSQSQVRTQTQPGTVYSNNTTTGTQNNHSNSSFSAPLLAGQTTDNQSFQNSSLGDPGSNPYRYQNKQPTPSWSSQQNSNLVNVTPVNDRNFGSSYNYRNSGGSLIGDSQITGNSSSQNPTPWYSGNQNRNNQATIAGGSGQSTNNRYLSQAGSNQTATSQAGLPAATSQNPNSPFYNPTSGQNRPGTIAPRFPQGTYSNQHAVNAAGQIGIPKKDKFMPLVLTGVGLMGSIGANLFLGFGYLDARHKYLSAIRRGSRVFTNAA